MISCSKCGKDNQDHYKFCLGCGAELPRGAQAKSFAPQTPSRGVQAGAPAAAAPAAAAPASSAAAAAGAPTPAAVPRPQSSPPAGAALTCPQCAHVNGAGSRFCASCGYNLSGAARPSASPGPAASAAVPAQGITLTALRADGSEAGTYRLPDAPSATVGRDTGSIFAGDSYLSPRHVSLARRGGQVFVSDAGSLNGVYLKLKANDPCPLQFGDQFRIGQEIIRFEELKSPGKSPDGVERFGSPAKGFIGRLSLVIGRDTTGNAFPVPEHGVHCGRERGDILFPEDGYVSGLHCRVAKESDGKVYLTDVGSSNGTFVRLRAERAVAGGDVLLMGQQLFRVDY